jgi:mono/diheme cytochrome c family protein
MKKIILILLSIIVLIVVGFLVFVNTSYDVRHEQSYPELAASTDSAVIARGKYLVYGPAHCASCHTPMDKMVAVDQGADIPLSGGWALEIPPGTFRAPNLTPDMETGIGSFTDGEIARAMRYAVAKDGRALFPFMPFQEMSDEDVVAIISFLRSQEPVKNMVPPTEYSFLGKALLALGAIGPEGPKNTPPKVVKKDSSVVYGKYLANIVANCAGCHTERDLKSGEFIGEKFAGGMQFPPDNLSQGYSFVSPNITMDKSSGVIASWTEKSFIARFRSGRVHKTSPMPWGSYSRMDEIELKALWRYLSSLDPVQREVAQTVFEPGEQIP